MPLCAGTVSAVTTPFEQTVRSKLIANKLAGEKPDSIRGLARTMAKGDPGKAETFKRSLFKWMAPGEPTPSPASRALVAQALGLAADELSSGDDEEPDPAVFGLALQQMFEQAVEKAIDRRLKAMEIAAQLEREVAA